MIIALFAAGVLAVISGIVAGIMMGNLGIILGGIALSLLFFGAASILQNQEEILSRLQGLDEFNKNKVVKKGCEKCGQEYKEDQKSCPYCGFRNKK